MTFLTDTDGSSKARMNLSVWFVGERMYSVRPPRNILWEIISQAAQASLWTLAKKKKGRNLKSQRLLISRSITHVYSDQNDKEYINKLSKWGSLTLWHPLKTHLEQSWASHTAHSQHLFIFCQTRTIVSHAELTISSSSLQWTHGCTDNYHWTYKLNF